MHLTPHILEQAYEYLRATPPFKALGLPHADQVAFKVSGTKTYYGMTTTETAAPPLIEISAAKCRHTAMLMETMAHEMIHVAQAVSAARGVGSGANHGKLFKRLARQVCRQHGFDIDSL